MTTPIDNPPVSTKPFRRRRGRLLFMFAAFGTVVALLYTEENWRGRRDLEAYRREIAAKGEKLDWNDFVKPPVPDDQNFLKAPLMDGWFNLATTNKPKADRLIQWPRWLRHVPPGMAELKSWDKLSQSDGLNKKEAPTEGERAETPAEELLRWFAQYDKQFKALFEASERPQARLDRAFDAPWSDHILNYVSLRTMSQILAARAEAYLMVGRPEEAARDLRVIRRLMDLQDAAQPTLVSAMIRVAIGGLYAEVVVEGWREGLWREPQWIEIEEQLRPVHFLADLAGSFRGGERAGIIEVFDHFSRARMAMLFDITRMRNVISGKAPTWMTERGLYNWLAPRGWFCQNELLGALIYQTILDDIDLANDRISPSSLNRDLDGIEHSVEGRSPYNFLVVVGIPNFRKAVAVTTRNQTLVNEVRIVCALERHKKAMGQYPETLDALAPIYIEKLSRELVNGQPLKYRRNNDGTFLLYSVGWDEKDDGGSPDKDWVWGEAVWK